MKRNAHRDLAGEREAIGPGAGGVEAAGFNKKEGCDQGFMDTMGGVLTGDIMDRAIKDKFKLHEQQMQAEQQGAQSGGDLLGVRKKKTDDEDSEDEDEGHDGKGANWDDDLERIRAERVKKMREQFKKREEYKAKGHGEYSEIKEEDFLKTVTSSHRTVVHFYHNRFESCKVADMHLKRCAKKFFGTKFVKLDAEKAPFFVGKLAIQTLPTMAMFIDGVMIWKQLGFAGLYGEGEATNEFKTGALARIFRDCGAVEEEFDSDGEFPDP